MIKMDPAKKGGDQGEGLWMPWGAGVKMVGSVATGASEQSKEEYSRRILKRRILATFATSPSLSTTRVRRHSGIRLRFR